MKKVAISGGTGLIGKEITNLLLNEGYTITILSRNISKVKSIFQNNVSAINSYELDNEVLNHLEGFDAFINLSGEPVFGKRWTKKQKDLILSSRIESTNNIVELISKLKSKPKTVIFASAIGIYGTDRNKIYKESDEFSDSFLSIVTQEWENASKKLDKLGIRRVNLRIGIVLSIKGGALKQMLTPYYFYIGGPIGDGNQWFPWIHIKDLAGMFRHSIESNTLQGEYNAVSPEFITMNSFCETLSKIIKKPNYFRVPSFAVKILFGEAASTILEGARISSEKIISTGFTFNYSNSKDALINLFSKN